jgi:alpha-1,3-glucan synthase
VGATNLPPEGHLQSPGTRTFSILSFDEAVGNRKDFSLQKTDPTFKDTDKKYYRAFQNMLHKLDGKTSEGRLCIEKYLIESEMGWNKRRREAKRDRGRASKASSPDGSIYIERRGSSLASLFGWTPAVESESSTSHEQISESSTVVNETDEFMLDDDHDHESFLKRWMVTKVLGWPIYSLLLVFGQIIAANSYQITLFTGSLADSGEETSERLYILGTIYVATSCMWWLMFRSFKSIFALSLPFFFYGLSFLLIGILASLPGGVRRDWMARAATGV